MVPISHIKTKLGYRNSIIIFSNTIPNMKSPNTKLPKKLVWFGNSIFSILCPVVLYCIISYFINLVNTTSA